MINVREFLADKPDLLKNYDAAQDAYYQTLTPSAKAVKMFLDYAGTRSNSILDPIREAIEKGYGVNDYGISLAIQSDAGKQQLKAIKANPVQATTGQGGMLSAGLSSGSGLPSLTQSTGDRETDELMRAAVAAGVPEYAARITVQPGLDRLALDWDEGGRHIDNTGLGVFGPIASIAGVALGMPALTALSFAAQNPHSPLSVAGPALGAAQAGAFDSLKPDLFGGGFSNPAAVDITGAGTGANALGLGTEQWAGLQSGPGYFVNPSAIATPTSINNAIGYVPKSLGGQAPKGNLANNVVDAGLKLASSLLPVPSQGPTGGLLAKSQATPRSPYTALRAPPPPAFSPYFKLATRAT